MSEIADRLATVLARIQEAAGRCGRDAAAVRLVAVAKHQPAAAVAALADLGHWQFGESRAQEAVRKIDTLADPRLEWHFLGPLQRNKARFLPGRFQWVHSLDSLALAETLARHANAQGHPLRALLEVNVTRDPRKHGLLPDAIFPFLETYCERAWPGLILSGLMTIGPHGGDARATSQTFAALRELGEACRTRFGLSPFNELSMGMSDDYPQAIAEGATIVRIGQALFGERRPL
ncbi:MAG TPA: YggS family pyridoxal phosphate-dependent enzyme [Acidiferrobacter sp.]|nr:YggS family pyridoxal phosphate-dependent enzyme [Acidiferrobacter sp.]